ncbi:MAG: hypothetical protein AAFU03_02795, partial [Bacteroidota bacterium]
MKKVHYLFSALFLILISTVLVYSCTDLAAAETEVTTQNDLILAYNAEEFLAALEADGHDFSGLILRVRDARLEFEKVRIENSRFSSLGLMPGPIAKLAKVDLATGYIMEESLPHPGQQFAYWQNTFELSYLAREELTLLAINSDNLYFSGIQVQHGISLAGGTAKDIRETPFFSIKV